MAAIIMRIFLLLFVNLARTTDAGKRGRRISGELANHNWFD